MTKYTTTHACGHQEAHHFQGDASIRAAWSERQADRGCSACRQKARNRRETAAEEWARDQGLPPLVGGAHDRALAEVARHETLTSPELRKAAR